MSDDGMVTVSSPFGTAETIDRLEAEIKAKGMTIFARIDHSAGAAAVGMLLRPTALLIFGNARSGTPFMQADQKTGIDLPLKALVHEDPAGRVLISYNDVRWLARRHGLGDTVAPSLALVAAALNDVITKTSKPH